MSTGSWRSHRAVLVATATTLALLGSGCTADRVGQERQDLRGESRSTADQDDAITCADVREQGFCRVARTSEGTEFRYAVVPPAAGAEESVAALVDLGGPGVALFGHDWPGTQLQAVADTTGKVVLALEEPWVRRAYPAGCKGAAAAWFGRLHAGEEDDGAEFAAACRLGDGGWSWDPAAYAAAVEASARAEGLEVDLFVGSSFAGERLTYLPRPPADVVLVSPFGPGTTAAAYLRDRLRSTAAFCRDRGAQVCGEPASSLAADARSLDVTPFDVGAAWIATNYQPDPSAHRRVVADPASDPALVGALSDAVTGRFGTTDVSPSTFAYFAELCPSLTGWDDVAAGDPAGDPAGGFLRAWHAVCRQLPAAAPARPVDRTAAVCLVTYRRDGVLPPRASLSAWRERADRVVALAGEQHGTVDAEVLRACRIGASDG